MEICTFRSGEPNLGRARIHGELKMLGFGISERTGCIEVFAATTTMPIRKRLPYLGRSA
jgi:hypothetical protein